MELYRIEGLKLQSLKKSAFKLEKQLQSLIEANLEIVFGMRFVASEFSTGDKHGGRIDSLGIDENGTPVIVEYKLSGSQSIISQGLFYLDWLLDHHGDFELLVQKKLGADVSVDWSSPRVVCVAESFSKYDNYAVTSIGANIQLVTYTLFGDGYLGIDTTSSGLQGPGPKQPHPPKPKPQGLVTHTSEEHLSHAKGDLKAVVEELFEYLSGLGDDVTVNPVQEYIAFRTTHNFCCLEPHNKHVFLYLTLDPALGLGCAFCRDVSKIGHFGTGDLEVRVEKAEQVEKAKELALMAYEKTAT